MYQIQWLTTSSHRCTIEASATVGSATLLTEFAARCTPCPRVNVTAPTPNNTQVARAARPSASTIAAQPMIA